MRPLFHFMLLLLCVSAYASGSKSRLVILADMGNEPDEEQQMMHMLMYSNEFDLEGLIAVTGKFLRPEANNPYKQKLHPELFHALIDGFGKVRENLTRHADDWPEPSNLHAIVASGQPGYGIEGIGDNKSTDGSEMIIDILSRDDPRPVYLVVNAGSNTLAQALYDYRKTHSQDEVNTLIKKLRVYENGAQDDAGAWICHHFPAIHWVRSNYQTYCYGGPSIDGSENNRGDQNQLGPYTWEPYAYSGLGQHQWALEHIIGNHGAFGNYYPIRQFGGGGISFLEGGGTIPWLTLIPKGLTDPEKPHWGGWSGRFTREKVRNVWSKHGSVNTDEQAYDPFFLFTESKDYWVNPEDQKRYDSLFSPVWRWRRAIFNDFKCRMDWCKKSYKEVNHNPVVRIKGLPEDEIGKMIVQTGSKITLDAGASSDPDADALTFHWWVYQEAGTYRGPLVLSGNHDAVATFDIPDAAKGKEIHLILEIRDNHPIASLYDYQRVVFSVE